MLSRFAKVLLVLTAFAPILFTVAFVQWRKGTFSPWGPTCIAVAALLSIICYLVLTAASQHLEKMPCRFASIKTADKEIVGFVLSYLVPLANLSGGAFDPWTLAFVAVFFLFIVATSHAYHFNPLMSVLGYHFYEVTDTGGVSYVLITRRSLYTARSAARVVQLSEYIILDVDAANA
jgi:hypothetical protein